MSDITFNGLTSVLKGNLYETPTIKKLAYNFPQSHGTVGSVPAEWLTNIPRENRENFIKELYKTFSNIVEIQREKIFSNKICSKILKDFFVKNGVINKNEKFRVSYSGAGSFAEVLKFNVGRKVYALKIFQNNNFLESITSEFGNCAEQNNALYIGATEKSDWVKFYFGNIFDKYMITKYVGNNTPLPRKKINLYEKGLRYVDYDIKNIKNNINIDYGGHAQVKYYPVGNKVAMWTIKRLKKLSPEVRAQEIEKIISDKKVPNYYDRMVGVDYVKNFVLPQEQELQTKKHGFWHSLIRAFIGMYAD